MTEYAQATLLDLTKITCRNWGVLGASIGSYSTLGIRRFMSDLGRLSKVRNKLFHPVRREMFSEDDFELGRTVRRTLFGR